MSHTLGAPVRRALAVVVCALAALAVLAPSALAGGAPKDYDQNPGLTEPKHEVERSVHRLAMHDGVLAYVEVVKPKDAGRYPVILEASPYHGTLADRDGTRILPEPTNAQGQPIGLTGYFAPRGYAVVMMDLRGTGRSQGCLDHLGQNDAKDLEQVVEWAASEDWSNGKVGMTGHSYVGSTPAVAAAQDPEGLATIVPSAGLASMYDHQFQAGVPYFLQWAGPIEAYEQLALQRHLPPYPNDPFGIDDVLRRQTGGVGDNFGNDMQYFGCGAPNSAAVAGEDQLSGRYSSWHADRDWREGATAADIPMFLVHGVNDNAARVPAMQWFSDRGGRPKDKIWLGQWDHGTGCCPTRRAMQWTLALHAWFDKHLAGRDVDTGPKAEMFLADGTFEEARTGARTEVLTDNRWPADSDAVTFHADANGGGLSTSAPAGDGSGSFSGDPQGHVDPKRTDGVEFTTGPVAEDMVLAGVPELRLSASVTTPRVHLIANVYDESPDGSRRRISQFAINPELRNGIETREPVVPGERYDMDLTGMAMAHHLRAGHELVLRVVTSDPDKVPLFSVDPQVTVFTGAGATALELPVVRNAKLWPDPMNGEATGPAQPPVTGEVTVIAPGGGVQVGGLTTEYFEFEVLGGYDNARTAIRAEPRQPADVDLYLERQAADGSWEDTGDAGESFSLVSETISAEGLEPGRYRVGVHSWAAAPANTVDMVVRFYNAAGAAG